MHSRSRNEARYYVVWVVIEGVGKRGGKGYEGKGGSPLFAAFHGVGRFGREGVG